MNIEENLFRTGIFTANAPKIDYVPILGNINAALDLFVKPICYDLSIFDNSLNNRDYRIILDRNPARLFLLLVPVLGNIIVYIGDSFYTNRTKEVLNQIRRDPFCFPYLPEYLKEDQNFAIEAILIEPFLFSLRYRNKEFILNLLDRSKDAPNRESISFKIHFNLSEELKIDPDIIFKLLDRDFEQIIEGIDQSFFNDIAFMKKLLYEDEFRIDMRRSKFLILHSYNQYFRSKLMEDEDYISDLLLNLSTTLDRYELDLLITAISPDLLNTPDFIKTICHDFPPSYVYADLFPNLMINKELFDLLSNQLGQGCLNNKEFMFWAIEIDPFIVNKAGPDLKKDKEFIIKAFVNCIKEGRLISASSLLLSNSNNLFLSNSVNYWLLNFYSNHRFNLKLEDELLSEKDQIIQSILEQLHAKHLISESPPFNTTKEIISSLLTPTSSIKEHQLNVVLTFFKSFPLSNDHLANILGGHSYIRNYFKAEELIEKLVETNQNVVQHLPAWCYNSKEVQLMLENLSMEV